MTIGIEDRKLLIERELEAHKKNGSNATYKILFRGEELYLPVIKVNPNSLLLNPNNNRLAGQLYDHPNRSEVLSDPYTVNSQNVLHHLLSSTDQFKDLKDQLKGLGQRDPGLITREGLLVNGNTRVAALKEIDINFVSVAVLPPNVLEDDIFELEMSLQVQSLIHQDYTFTNELLLMKRFLNGGGTTKELAKKMGWMRGGIKKVDLRMRLLNYIEEVRRLKTPPIAYSEFDSKEQHLKDLDGDYLRLKNEGDIQGAETLKWSRLSAIFLRLNKDQVRAIDEEFISVDLIERLSNTDEEMKSFIEGYRVKPLSGGFTSLLGDDVDEVDTINMQLFLRDFLNDEPDLESAEEDSKYAKIRKEARRVADRIIDDQKSETLKMNPISTVEEIREKVVNLRETLPELLGTDGFKKGKFEFNLKKLKDEIARLESIVN